MFVEDPAEGESKIGVRRSQEGGEKAHGLESFSQR
jgi:hypothetical protein